MINCSFATQISTVTVIISFITILIIIKNREFCKFDNYLRYNASVAITFNSIVIIIDSIYGFLEDWAITSPSPLFPCLLSLYIPIAPMNNSVSICPMIHLFFWCLEKECSTTYGIIVACVISSKMIAIVYILIL
jgi:hypothetical protein